MGKNTDRLYLTAQEWKQEFGGFKSKGHLPFQRLPFNCCAIAFTPFEDAVCTADGTVYDVTNIVPYIQKHHTHPVSGEPLALTDLIPLTFHKNSDGEYQCPILNKVFTQHTHIVAVKPSGNVYCYEAIQELNAKPKCWRDLLTDEPFTRKDIIHIQDPQQLAKRELARFDHVKRELEVAVEEEEPSSIRNASATMQKVMATLKDAGANELKEPSSRRALAMAQVEDALKEKREAAKARLKAKEKASSEGKAHADAHPSAAGAAPAATADDDGDDWRLKGPDLTRTVVFKPGASTWDTDDHDEAERKIGKRGVAELKRRARDDEAQRRGRVVPSEWWHAHYAPRYHTSVETTGAASRSFTSTSRDLVTTNTRVRKIVHRDPTKKAYMQLLTSKGALNLELHCDVAPRTCENFIALCEMGYYTGTRFHRSIRNFMIQGGDPTGTGEGGESIYGKPFADEIDSRLSHDGRGVLAMANNGKDANGSQFFILYKSARHLDFKHAVFGRVVGGLETLSAMEAVKTRDGDRPVEDITITGYQMFVNPYRELIDQEKKADELEQQKVDLETKGIISESDRVGTWFSNPRAATLASQSAPAMGPPAARAAHPSPDMAAQVKAPTTASHVAKKAKPNQASEFDAW